MSFSRPTYRDTSHQPGKSGILNSMRITKISEKRLTFVRCGSSNFNFIARLELHEQSAQKVVVGTSRSKLELLWRADVNFFFRWFLFVQQVVVNGKISLNAAVEQITPHDWRLSVTVELASSLFKQDEHLNAMMIYLEQNAVMRIWCGSLFLFSFLVVCYAFLYFKVRGKLDANSLAVMDYQMKV